VKKIIYYISYFFYLLFHWNLFLAFFITWHEAKRGPRYGINTVKPEKLKKLTITEGDISKSSPYEAVSYYLLEKLMNAFRKFSNDTSIIDLGCGKGRVMAVAAHFGFTSITGIDFAKELCEEAEKNMQKVQQKFKDLKWKVICSDVLNYELQENDSIFFMFNPFEKEILEKFLQKIESSTEKYSRSIYFLYASPLHLAVLSQYGYEIIYHINPKKKMEAVIVKKQGSLSPDRLVLA